MPNATATTPRQFVVVATHTGVGQYFVDKRTSPKRGICTHAATGRAKRFASASKAQEIADKINQWSGWTARVVSV